MRTHLKRAALPLLLLVALSNLAAAQEAAPPEPQKPIIGVEVSLGTSGANIVFHTTTNRPTNAPYTGGRKAEEPAQVISIALWSMDVWRDDGINLAHRPGGDVAIGLEPLLIGQISERTNGSGNVLYVHRIETPYEYRDPAIPIFYVDLVNKEVQLNYGADHGPSVPQFRADIAHAQKLLECVLGNKNFETVLDQNRWKEYDPIHQGWSCSYTEPTAAL